MARQSTHQKDFLAHIHAYCAQIGVDPHEFLADVIAMQELDVKLRMQAAEALAPYMQPKLKAVEHRGQITHDTQVTITFGPARVEEVPE